MRIIRNVNNLMDKNFANVSRYSQYFNNIRNNSKNDIKLQNNTQTIYIINHRLEKTLSLLQNLFQESLIPFTYENNTFNFLQEDGKTYELKVYQIKSSCYITAH